MKILINTRNIKIIEKEKIYTGNVNTYIINVEYEDYNFFSEYNCYLTFKNNDLKKKVIIGPDLKVIIPFDVLSETGNLIIGFFAIKVDEKEKLIRYSSEIEVLPVEKGGFDEEASEPEELTPTILEKYLQEMKNFYNESLEKYNNNANEKTEEFNKNYGNKKAEIDKVAEVVSKDKSAVEEMKKSVETSEGNAKKSEQSAQNSAKKASEIETNIISIQQDINASKSHIDSQKESIDNSVENVEKLVDEATNQANISKEQAEISTTNAAQTSADKTSVETMRNEVSSMKTSVEQTKTDTEQIKNDTQALKEETLQAKEEVENSLENERIESDKKYARAIDSDIVEINNYGQVDCDNEGYMKDIEIESTLAEITQDTREGYNKFNIDTIVENKYIYANNSNTDPYYGKLNNSNSSNTSDYIPVSENTNYLLTYDYDTLLSGNERGYCFYDENKAPIVIDSIVNSLYSVTNKKATFITPTSAKYLRFSYDKNCNNIQLIEGTEEKPYEEYGATPTLNYPSEFKNILSSFNIKNTVNEIEKYDKQITLPENKFLGTFNGYKNFIKDNKLKSNLKIVEFDGTENWTEDISENRFGIYNISTLILSNSNQICTHFKTYNAYAQNINSFGVGSDYIRVHNDNNMTLEEWKAYLAQQKEAGTPLQILYISNEGETQLEEINLALYQGINNISSEDLKLNFKYNVSIEKYIEENNANERRISDSKYARALKAQVEDVQQTQIYADNSEVEKLAIKGVQLTQEIREGYNLLSTENLQELNKNRIVLTKENGIITINGQSTSANFIDDYFIGSSNAYEEFLPAGRYTVSGITGEALSPNFGILIVIKHTDETTITIIQNSENKVFNVDDGDTFRVFIRIPQNLQLNNIVIRPMIVAGEESKDFEEYGASPSLDFPSNIQMAKEQNISVEGKNKCRGWMNTTSTVIYGTAFLIKADLKPNTKYTISFLTPNFEAEYYRAEELTSNWFTVINNSKRQSFTFTTKADISNAYKEYNGEYGYLLFKNAIATPSPANFSDVMLVEGDIDVPYEPYYGHDVNIPLTNNSIGNYFDVIDRENKVQDKVIQELILTGNENYKFNNVENGIYQYSITPAKKPIYINDSIIRVMSNYFKGVGRDGSWNIDNSITTNMSNIRFMTSQYTTVEEFKAKIKELYEAGKSVKIYYVSETIDKIPLSEEIKQELNKFKLYDDLNNVFIDNGSLSFIYNKSLLRALQEKDDEIDNLQSQIDEIKALLSSTSTASLLLENLANDNESEVS